MTVARHRPEAAEAYDEEVEPVPSEELAADPVFWFAHLLLILHHDGDEPEAYGVP